MNAKNDKTLMKKYPKIFAQRGLPMTQTCMCWGFDVGDGWFDILDCLCELIVGIIGDNKEARVEAVQVKEKYGGLRFYYDTSGLPEEEANEVSGAVRLAERLSYRVCEDCGSPGKPNERGWIRTQCGACRKKS